MSSKNHLKVFLEAWKTYYERTCQALELVDQTLRIGINKFPSYKSFLLDTAKETNFLLSLDFQSGLDKGKLSKLLGPLFTQEIEETGHEVDVQLDEKIIREAQKYDTEIRSILKRIDRCWPPIRKVLKSQGKYKEVYNGRYLKVEKCNGFIPVEGKHLFPRLGVDFPYIADPPSRATFYFKQDIESHLDCYIVAKLPLAENKETTLERQYEDMEILLDEVEKELRQGKEKESQPILTYKWELKDGRQVYCNGKGPVKLEPRLAELFEFLLKRKKRKTTVKAIKDYWELGGGYKYLVNDRINKLISTLDNNAKIFGLKKGEIKRVIEKHKDGRRLAALTFHAL